MNHLRRPDLIPDRQVYRPSRTIALVLAFVFVCTAGLLAWLGTILTQADLEAMDGFQRVFFSVVPIRPFSWTLAAVFAFLGVRLGLKGWHGRPSLIISTDGFDLGTGEFQPWGLLREAKNPKSDLLVLELLQSEAEASPGKEITSRSKTIPNQVTLSQFDLGADPRVVLKEIDRMRRDGD